MNGVTSNRLSVAPGNGRLSRSGRVVIFSLEPDDELHALRPRPGGEIFKTLATLIVARDFSVSPFAALDLEASSLFLFGDIEIEVDAVVVSGADSATWTEHRFTPGAVVMVAGMPVSSADTDLVEGCVPAAAFGLNLPAADTVQVDSEPSAATPVEPPDALKPRRGQAVPVDADLSEADLGHADLFDGDETEDPDLGVAPTPRPAVVDAEQGLDEQGPDEQGPDEQGSDEQGSDEQSPGSAAPAGGFRAPPPVTALRPEVEAATESEPEPASLSPVAATDGVAHLLCSNGQPAVVKTGLIVGRFPSKRGVPDGYDTFKVSGGEVSRVHLVFTVEAGLLYVQDQNTSNGSTLVGVDRAIRSVPSGTGRLTMSPGDSVQFGDHTIRFEGWA